MDHPLESFTKFMVAKYPNICPVCLGQKKLQFIGPMTRQLCVVTCHECNGTGEIREGKVAVG
jgi:DnaJ-class molecular chaperone